MSNSRRRSGRLGSSRGKPNPFENRGMDKFQQVYTELERMRESIAAKEGVSSSDVWFTRGNSTSGWVPVVIGKGHVRIPSPIAPEPDTVTEKIEVHMSDQSKQSPLRSGGSAWEIQNIVRRAMKLIALFVMVVAAVSEVCLAAVTGWISMTVTSLHRRSTEPSKTEGDTEAEAFPLCYSSLPNSPRGVRRRSYDELCTASTPASPLRDCQTYFTPVEREQGMCLPLRNIQTSTTVSPERQQAGVQKSSGEKQRHPRSPVRNGTVTHFTPERQKIPRESSNVHTDIVPVLLVVCLILSTLAAGKCFVVVTVCLTWYLLPLVRRAVHTDPRKVSGVRKGG